MRVSLWFCIASLSLLHSHFVRPATFLFTALKQEIPINVATRKLCRCESTPPNLKTMTKSVCTSSVEEVEPRIMQQHSCESTSNMQNLLREGSVERARRAQKRRQGCTRGLPTGPPEIKHRRHEAKRRGRIEGQLPLDVCAYLRFFF